jgi:parallel beta-helix repeat protein
MNLLTKTIPVLLMSVFSVAQLNAVNTLPDPEFMESGSSKNTKFNLIQTYRDADFSDDFSGGTGTSADPYKIANGSQLNQMRDYPDSHFILIANISLDSSPWNEGAGWTPVGTEENPFTGSFNGNNFVISGLRINLPDKNKTGLFGVLVQAEIKNIEFSGADIKGKGYTGILAGQIISSSISGTKTGGSVTATGEYSGGIIGHASESVISDCSSSAAVSGFRFTGGIAGSGSAENCTASGKISGKSSGGTESSCIGGLLGKGYAINCHASGEVTGGSEVGGLIGSGYARGCHASGNVTANADYAGGLIGDMMFDEDNSDNSEYQPGTAATTDTTRISGKGSGSGNAPVTIILNDGTKAIIQGNSLPVEATLTRSVADIDENLIIPDGSDFRITGAMRKLVIQGSGDAVAVKPLITIPAAEAGTINPDAINAMRVGTMLIDGELIENYTAVLPVWTDKNGNLKFVDALFPDGVEKDSTKSAGIKNAELGETVQASEMRWIGEVRYFLISFDNALNWKKRPVLERMIPDSTLVDDGFRRPYRNSGATERKKIESQPVCNIVILVHGHNEEEKDGFIESKISSPWDFKYKRLVWNILYEDASRKKDKSYPTECTAFYEFISPTYRSIFSPVSDKTRITQKTLGEDLGELVNQEIFSNKQYKAMMDNNIPFNLFIIAHSQGGLIARAGLRFIDPKILKNLKKVITWATPHNGAGLYTMRYVLAVGHDMIINDVRFPMQNIGQRDSYQSAVGALAIDAPGIRDLRWDASKPQMLRLGELFRENSSTVSDNPETELPNGKMFFSDNLKLFNENEGTFMGNLLVDKYKFYEGTTTKDAPLELSYDIWSLGRLYRFGKMATEIEKGAQLNKQVMASSYKASDGAVSVYSQRGESIYPAGNIQQRNVGNVDHEEFYGGEPPHRDETSIAKGKMVADFTYSDLEFITEGRKCPLLELEKKEINDSIKINGKLIFPLTLKTYGGDDLTGKKISSIEVFLDKPYGIKVDGMRIAIEDDGSFICIAHKSKFPDDTLAVVAKIKDESLVIGQLTDEIRDKVFNKSKKLWYTTIQGAIQESGEKDTIIVYPGTYKENLVATSKSIYLESKSGPESTIVESTSGGSGFWCANGESTVKGFTFKNFNTGIYYWNAGLDKTLKPTISGNHIINCDSKGIFISGQVAATIENNIITGDNYYGIDFDQNTLKGDARNVVRNNIISEFNRGIRIRGEAEVDIINNTIFGNDMGIEVNGKYGALIQGNTMYENMDAAIRCFYSDNNLIIKNNILRNNNNGIYVRSDGNFVITGNQLIGNYNGMVLELGVTKKTSAVIDNNTIADSKSIYAEGGSGISVVYSSRQGPVKITNNTISGNSGGGINLSATDSITITENIIKNNTALYGGGIYNNSSGYVLISKNTISGNTAKSYGGGIMIQSQTKTKVTGNKIESNSASEHGGGIYGTALGWEKTAEVTVKGVKRNVTRYIPCFAESDNTYSGNSHGVKVSEWGPGTDNWCADAGFDVYIQ